MQAGLRRLAGDSPPGTLILKLRGVVTLRHAENPTPG
jgi:hypothetical protein